MNKELSDQFVDYFEYNTFKTYFIIPFYPVFKPSNLRKDFNFALYLTFCLNDRLRVFFKLSWSCWFSSIIIALLWNVFLSTQSISFIVIFLFNKDLLLVVDSFTRNCYLHYILLLHEKGIQECRSRVK